MLGFLDGIAQSVQQLATGWTVWGSNPGGGTGNLLYKEYCSSFPVLKRHGRGVDHPLLFRPRLKKEYSSWPVLRGNLYLWSVGVVKEVGWGT